QKRGREDPSNQIRALFKKSYPPVETFRWNVSANYRDYPTIVGHKLLAYPAIVGRRFTETSLQVII
ncbi:MAG: hypothetical protein LH702_04925, partial [Phormidesmis sp. CAN_BIN44]|nr:hypothetical protein [Phormidesmis sp. CAN_BIN44]